MAPSYETACQMSGPSSLFKTLTFGQPTVCLATTFLMRRFCLLAHFNQTQVSVSKLTKWLNATFVCQTVAKENSPDGPFQQDCAP
jgi:hypothetical protein